VWVKGRTPKGRTPQRADTPKGGQKRADKQKGGHPKGRTEKGRTTQRADNPKGGQKRADNPKGGHIENPKITKGRTSKKGGHILNSIEIHP
jgi:hypothetical protein